MLFSDSAEDRGETLVGFVDGVDGRAIRGWAYDHLGREPPSLALVIDGLRQLTFTPMLVRTDLKQRIPNGQGAFEIVVPAACCNGETHQIEVVFSETGQTLTGGAFHFHRSGAPSVELLARHLTRTGLLCVDTGSRDGTSVSIAGWFVLPPNRKAASLLINGQPAALEHEFNRGLCDQFMLPPDAYVARFTATFAAPPQGDAVAITLGDARPFDPTFSFHLPLFDRPRPAPGQIQRVAGTDDGFIFDLYGYSIAWTARQLAERFSGKPFAELAGVLDWGCGCGRSARYMAGWTNDLIGVDIDEPNIAWCSANIPTGRFLAIRPREAMPIATASLDFVLGLSVLTHLPQAYETFWLQDLARVTRPGAILILSILGPHAMMLGGSLDRLPELEEAGFVDLGRNPDLDETAPSPEYYRNIFHSHAYVHQTWTRDFEILAIEEGAVTGNEDAVVLRRR